MSVPIMSTASPRRHSLPAKPFTNSKRPAPISIWEGRAHHAAHLGALGAVTGGIGGFVGAASVALPLDGAALSLFGKLLGLMAGTFFAAALVGILTAFGSLIWDIGLHRGISFLYPSALKDEQHGKTDRLDLPPQSRH